MWGRFDCRTLLYVPSSPTRKVAHEDPPNEAEMGPTMTPWGPLGHCWVIIW